MEQDRTGRNDQVSQPEAQPKPSETRHVRNWRDLDLNPGRGGSHLFLDPPAEGSPMDKVHKWMLKHTSRLSEKRGPMTRLFEKFDAWMDSGSQRSREQRADQSSGNPPSEPPTQK